MLLLPELNNIILLQAASRITCVTMIALNSCVGNYFANRFHVEYGNDEYDVLTQSVHSSFSWWIVPEESTTAHKLKRDPQNLPKYESVAQKRESLVKDSNFAWVNICESLDKGNVGRSRATSLSCGPGIPWAWAWARTAYRTRIPLSATRWQIDLP